MAPWDVDSAHPADDDIISQFPANERNSRSQIEGWMDYEHDKTTGRHKIPAGDTATRDGITEFVDGALWINTSFTPARLQMRVSGAWKDVGAGFAGDASIEGALTIVGSAATRLILERTGNANNAVAEFKTTDGSMFAGRANDTYFAIGSSNNLNTVANRWFEVAADHARVRGNFFATGNIESSGTITGNGSGLTNLNASNLSTGTLPNARLSGNYSFGSLTLSGSLTTGSNIVSGGNIQVNSNSINIQSDSNKTIRYLDSTGTTTFGALILNQSDGRLILRVYDASGSSVHHLELARDGNATFTGTIIGNGSGLTNLNASNISSGTLPAARLPNHSANLLTSGTLPAGRLSGNYSFGSLTLSGSLTAAGGVTAQGNQGAHYGDGTHVTIAPATGNETGRQIHLRPRGSGTSTRELLGTHEGWTIDGNPVATVSTTGSASTTTFPVGHNIMVYTAGTNYSRNASETIRIADDANERYRRGGSGTALSGTWRARGYVFGTDGNAYMFQRMA